MRKILDEILVIFWIFVLGSIFGCLFETSLTIFSLGHFELRKGLIYGPFNQVYGIGAVMYYLVLKAIPKAGNIKVFLVTFVLGGTVEYLTSFLQEKIFKTVSWDYSDAFLNINGRTSLKYCICWGLIGVLYKYIANEKILSKFKTFLLQKRLQIINIMCIILMFGDIFISSVAGIRQMQRRYGVEDASCLAKTIDKYYPDEVMDKIYSNKKDK